MTLMSDKQSHKHLLIGITFTTKPTKFRQGLITINSPLSHQSGYSSDFRSLEGDIYDQLGYQCKTVVA